jgi:N,N'-diacetyllegionaminate synthase
MTNRTFIIAEAGVNHNGRLDLARKLVIEAARAGADAVKFQTFKAEKLAAASAGKADYQTRTTPDDQSHLEMLKTLELDKAAHLELLELCRKNNIEFLSSPFDLESIDLLDELGLDTIKIPSGEITNLPYLRKVGALKRKIILSTGMAEMIEIEAALNVLTDAGTNRKNIIVLHCHTEYPTVYEDVNLLAMDAMRQTLGVRVGYSDHTLGLEAALAAVALGAEVIEKHFTLDRKMPGPDHSASLEPKELTELVVGIRRVEALLGGGEKKPTEREIKNRAVARKSIVAAQLIKKGEPFTDKNLTVKRPGLGINPMLWDDVIGRVAPRDFAPDEMIELSDMTGMEDK